MLQKQLGTLIELIFATLFKKGSPFEITR